MRAASLQTAPNEGNCGPSSQTAGARAPESEAATGPQRSLEPGSLVGLGATSGRMDATFDALPVATIVAYRDGAELLLNAAARTLLALDGATHLHSIDELDAHTPMFAADESPVLSPLSAALAGESTTDLAVSVHRDGTRRWLLDATPIREVDTVIGAVCTIRDITERMLDEEMGDDLLGRASHDLRTPLTALKASAQLIGRGFERLDEHARQRTLGLLLAQIDKLSTRIDEVMDASRIRRGRIDVHSEDLDLSAILREIVAEIGGVPGMPACELRAPDTLLVHADRARIRQILKRLALDAASRDTERIVLEATQTDTTTALTIEVVGGGHDNARNRTARRLAAAVFARLGGSAREDRTRRLVLTLPTAPR